ncbi:MAG: hypothetical protein AAFO82_07225 [Bacteroidota bacterium]
MRLPIIHSIRELLFGDVSLSTSATVNRALILFAASLLIGTFGYML